MIAFLSRLLRRSSPGFEWLDGAELRRRLASGTAPIVIDVRAPEEFTGPLGHIPEAVNIPLDELPARRPELAAAHRPLVFVCLTDKRSAQAAALLGEAGVAPAAVLRGGMREWRSD
ncbi:MAG: rhodanese-like domain-containing protein [Alphaproteobacteria bacterium]|nr:rhodanese-like domain-containing protein [Alphaproteobacteria bacterium]